MSSTPIYLGKDGKISGPFTPGQIEELRQNGQLYNYAWIWDVQIKGWKAIEEEVETPATGPVLPSPSAATEVIPVEKAEPTLSSLSLAQPITDSVVNLGSAIGGSSISLLDEAPLVGSGSSVSGSAADAFAPQTSPIEFPTQETPNTIQASPSVLTPETIGAGATPTVRPSFSVHRAAANSTGSTPIDLIDIICHNYKMMMNGKLAAASPHGCVFQSFLPVHDLATFKAGMKISMNLLNSADGQSENIRAVVRVVKRGEEYWEYDLSWDRYPQILGEN